MKEGRKVKEIPPLYGIAAKKIETRQIDNHLFLLGDVFECLSLLPNSTVDLVFTSPPYNVGIEYENHFDKMNYNKYLEWLGEVISNLFLKIKDDGRFIINIPSITAEGEYKPLFVDVINISQQVGFKLRNDIIWFKHQVSKRTAWGSFMSPSDPYVIQPYEFILVFNKKFKKHNGKRENIDITREEFINFSLAFWDIKPETRKEILKHCPVPFPEKLVYRVLKFYSYVGDTILDPFGGSGTVSCVSCLLNRKSIYIDNSKKSFDFAIKRTEEALSKMALLNLTKR